MYQPLIDALDKAERLLLTTHARPDGDALGSTAALALALKAKGKHAELLILSPMPDRLRFVYEDAGLAWHESPPEVESFDTLLICDTGTWSQLPGMQDVLDGWPGRKLVLDHHVTQEDWPDLHCVDTDAAAACEMAHGLLEAWGVEIDGNLAQPLYVGMATDTGWFAFSNTRPETMRRAADCVAAGADLDKVNQLLRQSDRPASLLLKKAALASLSLDAGGRVATMALRRGDYADAGATAEDGGDLVNEPMKVRDVRVSALLAEPLDGDDDRPTKVSLRSKGEVDVAAVCATFGGGGHVRAAGCRIDAPLEEAREMLLAELEQRLD